ncbi:DUF2892 domain-containing protein [Ornithinimicrobium sp. LYQ121]|uniref:YgaP family membrane protein n=1 Tax=Ornithinimicrobium sp. LYQ121 TaxID=3378801 RepID=UPI0038551571
MWAPRSSMGCSSQSRHTLEDNMTRNVGTVDRAIRTLLGLGAVAWGFSLGMASAAGIVLTVVAAVLLVTAAVGFCPLYRLLSISTDGSRDHAAKPVTR